MLDMRILSNTAALAACVVLLTTGRAEAQVCTSTQSCLTTHGTGGCNSATCCTSVCVLDPTCCSGSWDSECVSLANQNCIGYCGASVNGTCFAAHSNPACNNATCCAAVCAIDAFCCSATWDASCALYAGAVCAGTPGTCGVSSTGSCFTAHQNGACDNLACCTAVCTVDPTCCSSSWDFFCVTAAQSICVEGCAPIFEPNVLPEEELCGANGNDPCYAQPGGLPEPVTVGRQTRGALGRVADTTDPIDVDVFRFTVADANGDGSANVSLTFSSSPVAWAAIVPDTACAPIASALIHIGSQLCVDVTSAKVCLAAGDYRVIVAAGTYPTIGGADITCNSPNKYAFTINLVEQCGSTCNAATGSCFATHEAPGCAEPTCCGVVCAADPFCCENIWDSSCVARAGISCLTGPPANDTCASAQAAVAGTQVLNTLRADVEAGQQPKACAGATFVSDVWFRWTSDRSGPVSVETCGTWFDTVVAIYSGSCKSMTLVGCNDDAALCVGVGGSKVLFEALCGVEYLFRVGPRGPSTGAASGEAVLTLTLSGTVCPNCPLDLDGDGMVAASDLSLLLAGWGTPARDLDGDGTTGAADLSLLLAAWGGCA